eukprot:CAMPEP_0170188334 /NCGR_PEP_ID=MMETSP0040_2-20121228/44087_1 /TAXON_ID=641309 /ORGANISM="Lotharella oceanica, Strain CCMP622" /LENGTH=104 /DNA_ID=CAMNT_0010435609 /DNA_START=257 /DNA_END=571 /DNA_ORIENTATION=+
MLMALLSVCIAQFPPIGKELEFVVLPGYYWPWLALILFGYAAFTGSLMTTVLPRLLQSRGSDAMEEHGLTPVSTRRRNLRDSSSSMLFNSEGDKGIQVVVDKMK